MYYNISINQLKYLFDEIDQSNNQPLIQIEELDINIEKSETTEIERMNKLAQELWKVIKKSIYRVQAEGAGIISELLETVSNHIEVIHHKLKERYVYVKDYIEQRLILVMKALFEMAIKAFPTKLFDGSEYYYSKTLSINTEIKVGGDIKASITEIFKFVTEGKVQINILYEKNKS